MNFNFKSLLRFLFFSVTSLLFSSTLSAQNIFIDNICACNDGSGISSFTTTLGNWPTEPGESYDVIVNYADMGGGRSTVTATSVPGEPTGMIEVTFSNITNAADPGDIQITSVTNTATMIEEGVSPDFISYTSAGRLNITAPIDTTVSNCLLGGSSVAELFDAWILDASATGGCGDIDIIHDWDGTYPSCEESLSVAFTATNVSCGDTTISNATFTVEDCTKPTPIVVNGLVSVRVPSTGCIDVNVNMFDEASFDDCGEVVLSYSADTSDNVRTFCCDGNTDMREVEFWVTDEAGNQDYVISNLYIEGCNHSHPYEISGNITTKDGDGVQGVEVFLEDTASSAPINWLTSAGGDYIFWDIEVQDRTEFTIRPYKNDDVLNGVNTLDILYVQQHILGLNTLVDPYRLIAANVNDDDRISGADMIEMRRAILGVDSEFANNTSWRFVDATEVLQDGQLPMDYAEEIQLFFWNNSVYDQDFTAVKIGDVNGTATTNIDDSTEAEGNNSALRLAVLEADPERGELIEVDVTSDNFSAVLGFQFTLEHDLDALEFVELKGGQLDMGESNYAYFSEAGTLTLSWNGLESENYNSDEVLFTLVFRAKDQSRLSDALQFTDAITKSEAYIGGETRKLSLRFLQSSKKFALYQNAPNPFDSETIIKFDLPESGIAVLTFYDSAGKVVFVVEGEYSAGPNQVQIDRGDLPVQGLYFYELRSGEHRATKKMVVAGK